MVGLGVDGVDFSFEFSIHEVSEDYMTNFLWVPAGPDYGNGSWFEKVIQDP